VLLGFVWVWASNYTQRFSVLFQAILSWNGPITALCAMEEFVAADLISGYLTYLRSITGHEAVFSRCVGQEKQI